MVGQERKWLALGARGSAAAAIVAATAVGVLALHQRAGAGVDPTATQPVPVRAAPVAREPGYLETRSFAGRLEPARTTPLGFERPGRLIEVRFREGEAVAAGALVARLDTALLEAERDRLEASRAAQQASVELARLTDARQSQLNDAAASAQRRDEARLALVRAEAELAVIEAALEGVAIEIGKSELRAPFAGHVSARHADEGAILEPGAPVVALMETAAPRARIGLAPEVAEGLEPGGAYALFHRGRAHPARLAALRPDLDPASRTVIALFDLEPDLALAFGDVVEFAADAWRPTPGYWLPLAALSEAERGLWSVLTVEPTPEGDRVAREAVRVLLVEGERAFVEGAIPEGVAVISAGPHRVIPGQTVRLAAAE